MRIAFCTLIRIGRRWRIDWPARGGRRRPSLAGWRSLVGTWAVHRTVRRTMNISFRPLVLIRGGTSTLAITGCSSEKQKPKGK